MDRCLAILCEGVHRFEGMVDTFSGDGLMALFGAPLAQEDHAARGCHAALRMLERLAGFSAELRRERGLDFAVRVGLNSGEVVTGAIGDDLTLQYTAIGHTVGLARRVESLAAPNTALVSRDTAALVEGYFEVRDRGTARAQGRERAAARLRAGRARPAAKPSGCLARARPVAVRGARARARGVGVRARARPGGRRPGRGCRGRGGNRQEPALLRAQRTLPQERDRGAGRAVHGPRRAPAAAARARAGPLRLRCHRLGYRAGGPRQGGRPSGSPRPADRQRASAHPRAARNPRRWTVRGLRDGWRAALLDGEAPAARWAGGGAGRDRGRGAALDRPSERGVPEGAGRGAAGHAHPVGREFPPGVPQRLAPGPELHRASIATARRTRRSRRSSANSSAPIPRSRRWPRAPESVWVATRSSWRS